MKVILYSTGCPKCKVLTNKLDNAEIQYDIFDNVEEMINMGMTTIPVLEVNNSRMSFKEAVKWINERIGK